MQPYTSHERAHHEARVVNGVLPLNKPSGISSNDALQRVKRLYRAKKAGHTGSLDPLAQGLLLVCLGEATKFAEYGLNTDKVYYVKAKLGVSTDTLDVTGKVTMTQKVPPFTMDDIVSTSRQFVGNILQTPPMYSALKHQGQPLYALARKGIEIERPPRPITIYQLDILAYQDESVELTVHCSKGTYVRSLVADLGQALGCGAHVTVLKRLRVGHFSEHDMISLQSLCTITAPSHDDRFAKLDKLLSPVVSLVTQLPKLTLTSAQADSLYQGKKLPMAMSHQHTVVRLHLNDSDVFIGLGELVAGILKSKRLFFRRTV